MTRYADMFSGIGGFALGVMKALGADSVDHAIACDLDPSAADTYKRNFGQDSLGDISKMDMASLPDFDIVFGGFPCQPFSRNGMHYNKGRILKAGSKKVDKSKESVKIQDTRETRDELYTHLVTLLKEKRPARFLFENVKGLKTIKDKSGRSYFEVIKTAFEEARYQVHTRVLDAADFGLPQQRRRLFFVGFRNDIAVPEFHWPEEIPRTACIADILDSDVDEKYFLENLWSKRICAKLADENGKLKIRLQALKDAYEKPKKLGTGRIIPLSIIYGDTPSGGPRQMDKLYSIQGISPTIATFSTPAVDAPEGWRILTPRECARLQGFPDDFELPKSDAKAYRQIGNAVVVSMVAAIIERMFD